MTWQLTIFSYIVFNIAGIAARKLIIGGGAVTIANFPYQVSLRSDGTHFCGGAIITSKHIATAAHCFRSSVSPEWDTVTVVSGTTYAEEEGNVHEIANITTHPGYSYDGNSAQNDIAVITLKDPIIFDSYQKKINLPKKDYKVGEKAIVTGWGLTEQYPEVFPDKLQKLEAKILSKEECQKKVINPETTQIDDMVICIARRNNAGTCFGDSGGPLAAHGELIGIVSWTDGDYCFGDRANVFTNVYKYESFIESIINQIV